MAWPSPGSLLGGTSDKHGSSLGVNALGGIIPKEIQAKEGFNFLTEILYCAPGS